MLAGSELLHYEDQCGDLSVEFGALERRVEPLS